MREGIHRLTGTYCPHCQRPIIEVIATGYQLCSSTSYHCEYAVTPGATPPFSADLFNELQAIEAERKEINQQFEAKRQAAIASHTKVNTDLCSSIELQKERLK